MGQAKEDESSHMPTGSGDAGGEPATPSAQAGNGTPSGDARPESRPANDRATRERAGPTRLTGAPGINEREVVGDQRTGSRYVRIWQGGRDFRARHGRENVLEATPYVTQPRTSLGMFLWQAKRLLVGEPLTATTREAGRLQKRYAVGTLSANALSSVVYATEAMLGVLIVAGTRGLGASVPIAVGVVLLLGLVVLSYRQILRAYPVWGGSYLAVRDNLGTWPGLLAAAALLIDYTLTVAVAVSAAALALISAFPVLAGWKVVLCLVLVATIALANLRGIGESRGWFAAPTYLFIAATLALIGAGLVQTYALPGRPSVAGAAVVTGQSLGIFLILRAFASGCAALTGIEVIADEVPAFAKPEARNATITLAIVAAILGILFLGITLLVERFGLSPDPTGTHSLLALLALKIAGGGIWMWFYYVFQLVTVLILALAANSGFSDFPQVALLLARDGFAPHQFGVRGDRLTYSAGILTLFLFASVLLLVFRGNVSALLPLYVLGVFAGFALSQAAMASHWWRARSAGWLRKSVWNVLGAAVTGAVALIVAVSAFVGGAWVVVVLIPCLAFLFMGVHSHYTRVAELIQARPEALTPPAEIHHLAIVPVATLNYPTLRALAYACSVAPRVIAVHVAYDDADAAEMQRQWGEEVERSGVFATREAQSPPAKPTVPGKPAPGGAATSPAVEKESPGEGPGAGFPRLVIIESPYRVVTQPLVRYVDIVRRRHPDKTVTVILPEFVPWHFWQNFLHNQSALRLKAALLFRRDIVVTDVPYHLTRQIVNE